MRVWRASGCCPRARACSSRSASDAPPSPAGASATTWRRCSCRLAWGPAPITGGAHARTMSAIVSSPGRIATSCAE
eukprot:107873-Chlamydomonas_euryale.AAC.1